MTPATPGTRTRKIRRRGRHKAPSPVRKVAKRAGVAAPAVAVAGALAAAPHLQQSPTGSTPKVTGAATAQLVYPARTGNAGNAASALPAEPGGVPGPARPEGGAQAPAPPQRHAREPRAQAQRGARQRIGPTGRCARRQPAPGACPARRRRTGPPPANYAPIMSFLTSHGYTGNAAAGIAGNIYQESGRQPRVRRGRRGRADRLDAAAGRVRDRESAADLQTQLTAILAFNKIWSQYIPALNGASSPGSRRLTST